MALLSIISRSSAFKRTMSSRSFLDVTNRLVSPVKDLVNAISENGQKFTGETETDQKEVIDWILKSSEIVTEDRLKVYILFRQTNLLASEFSCVRNSMPCFCQERILLQIILLQLTLCSMVTFIPYWYVIHALLLEN